MYTWVVRFRHRSGWPLRRHYTYYDAYVLAWDQASAIALARSMGNHDAFMVAAYRADER
jgi:hypothetical protein